MKLAKSYSPVDELQGLAIVRRSGFHRLGDGPWSGTVTVITKRKKEVEVRVEEQESRWKLTDPDDRSLTGVSLTGLLTKVAER